MDERKGIQEPTQEAAQAVKEKEKKAEQMKKKAHKRQKQATTGSELDDTESGDSHKEAAISKESAKKRADRRAPRKQRRPLCCRVDARFQMQEMAVDASITV